MDDIQDGSFIRGLSQPEDQVRGGETSLRTSSEVPKGAETEPNTGEGTTVRQAKIRNAFMAREFSVMDGSLESVGERRIDIWKI